MFKKILLIATLLFTANAHSADYFDTQYGEDGMEVHIMKVTFNKNIMTIVFAVENTSDEEITYKEFPIKQVYVNTGDKKYPIIKDAKGDWLASTVGYNADNNIFADRKDFSSSYTFKIKSKGKKIGWMKFEKPQDADWPLDLNFPGVTPFTLNKPQ